MPEANFFWEPLSDNIRQERDETSVLTAEYTTEPELYGNLISQNRGGVESQYHFDAVGSTLALSDDNQQVTDTRAYTAFGEVTEHSGSATNPFTFTGQKGLYFSAQLSEYFSRNQPYAPSTSRVLSAAAAYRLQTQRQLSSMRSPTRSLPSLAAFLLPYSLLGLEVAAQPSADKSDHPPGERAAGGNVCAFVTMVAPLKERDDDKSKTLYNFYMCQAKCVAERGKRTFTVVSIQDVLDLITNGKCCTLYACCHQGGDKGNLGGCYTYGGKEESEPVFIFGPKAKDEKKVRDAFRAAGCKDCVINLFSCGGVTYSKEEAEQVEKNRQVIADNTCCKVCGSQRPVGPAAHPVHGEGGILGSQFCPEQAGRPPWKYDCVDPKVGLEKCNESE